MQLRQIAVKDLNPTLLRDMAWNNSNENVCILALENIHEENFLQNMAPNAARLNLRKVSKRRFTEFGFDN